MSIATARGDGNSATGPSCDGAAYCPDTTDVKITNNIILDSGSAGWSAGLEWRGSGGLIEGNYIGAAPGTTTGQDAGIIWANTEIGIAVDHPQQHPRRRNQACCTAVKPDSPGR